MLDGTGPTLTGPSFFLGHPISSWGTARLEGWVSRPSSGLKIEKIGMWTASSFHGGCVSGVRWPFTIELVRFIEGKARHAAGRFAREGTTGVPAIFANQLGWLKRFGHGAA